MLRLLLVLAPCLAFAAAPPESSPRLDAFGDALPDGALVRLGTVRFRQSNSVTCLAMSPDGKTLLAGSYSNAIHVWDAARPAGRGVWPIESYSTSGLRYTPDGKLVVADGTDGVVRLLDAETGVVKRSLADPTGHSGNVCSALSLDRRTLVVCYRYEQQVVVWDLVLGAVRHRMTNMTTYNAPPPLLTPDGKRFVALWSDSRLHLIDVATGKSVRCLEPGVAEEKNNSYNSRVAGVALSVDGKTMVYRTTNEPTFLVVDVETAKVTRRVTRTGQNYYSSQGSGIALSPNGRFVYEAPGDGAIRIWGLASGKALRELTSPSGSLYHLCGSADGKTVAGGYNNLLSVWDVPNRTQLHPGAGHGSSITRLAFSPDGGRLFSAGSSTLRGWDVKTGREVAKANYSGANWANLTVAAGGQEARWVGYDRARYVWRVSEGKEPERLTQPRQTQYYSTQAVSPDGKLLAGVHNQDRRLRLIPLLEAKPERELATANDAYSNSLVFSPDGRTLAFGQRDRTVTLYDTATGEELRRIRGAGPGFSSPQVVFASDGRSLLVWDGELRLIERLTGGERARFPLDASYPGSLALSEDGRVVARGHHDGVVSVYDAWTGRELLRRQTGQGTVSAVAVSRDNRRLATGGANTTTLVWELPPLGDLPRSTNDDEAWRTLGGPSAEAAYRATLHFLASPAATPGLFRERLRPPAAADPKRIAKLVADLDAARYEDRERALIELAEAGPAARDALRKAARSLTLEVKRRAEDLLSRLGEDGLTESARLRALRAVEVLSRLDTPSAREALRELLRFRLGPTVDAAVKEALGEAA